MQRRTILASGMAAAVPLFSPLAWGQASKSKPVSTVAYGDLPQQDLDIYLPQGPCYAWVALVHGGGWRRGDKAMARMVDNKVARWNAHGIAVVSINYRMLPEAAVEVQVADVRSAISFLQRKSSTLGLIGPMVLMGHSAGGHLAAMVSSQIQSSLEAGLAPWAGTVILDSAALDVPKTMDKTRLPLYRNAFGPPSRRWLELSPMHQVQPGVGPTMVVYSSSRRDDVAEQSQLYAQRLSGAGVQNVQLLGVQLSHAQINELLGKENDYTQAVESFMGSVHPSFGQALKG